MLLNPLTFHSPKSLNEAVKLFSELPNPRLQAGGTFLLNSLKLSKKKGLKTPDHVIALNKVPELKGIILEKNQLIIKAMTTIDELFESRDLVDNFAVFKIVCRNISTQQIRNAASVGGNLTCRYTWTEMPAAMIGLGAKMHFIGIDAKEETLDAENFFQNAAKTDKIFTHVSIPREPKALIAYRRVKKTQFVDIPLLSMLIKTSIQNNQFTNTIISINNCVDFAQRDKTLEDFLNKNKVTPTFAEEALKHLDEKIYEKRSSDYKKHMFHHCIKSSLEEIIGKIKK